MKTPQPKARLLISGLIAALALLAAGIGVFGSGGGSHYDFTSLRGQTVQIWGGTGIYRLDSVAGAAQEIAQDVITLVAGIPLLVLATVLAARGSLRGRVLHAGTLAYFLYTYTSMSMLTSYNALFLVYVALMSLSLFGLILALRAIDVATLPAHFGAMFPRRLVAGFLLFVGGALALLWLGRIGPPLLAGTAPAPLDAYTTLVIQALDLGFVVPAAILTAVLLWRREPWGYLLAAVVLVKAFMLGLATSAMAIGQQLAGVAVSPAVAALFFAFASIDIVLTGVLLRSLREEPVAVGLIPAVNVPPALARPGEYQVSTPRSYAPRGPGA